MDKQVVDQAKEALNRRDFARAVQLLQPSRSADDVDGEARHVLGNAYMMLGQYKQAAEAYELALEDSFYGKRGALLTNLGRARIASRDYRAAVDALTSAVEDESYATPYKSYFALGSAYTELGEFRKAGVAFRKSALDENNPNTTQSLINLGSCFIELKRGGDAVESLRTALEFASSNVETSRVYAELGRAYVSMNRMEEAVNAFERAIATTPGYQLSEAAFSDYTTAREVAAARKRAAAGSLGGETDEFLRGLDPQDPESMSHSGPLMPSPDDSGFFQISEDELTEISKKQMKAERKNKRTGLKVFITLLIIILLIACGLGFAFYKGYGFPTQESTVESMFQAHAADKNVSEYWTTDIAEPPTLEERMLEVAKTSNVRVDGIDRDTFSSQALVTAQLDQGGTVHYIVDLKREGISWKISNIELTFLSQTNSNTAETTPTDTESTVNEPADTESSTPDENSENEGEQDSETGEASSVQPDENDNGSTENNAQQGVAPSSEVSLEE